jgi:hypothetical protein
VLSTHPPIVWSAVDGQLSRAARRFVDLHLGLGPDRRPVTLRRPPPSRMRGWAQGTRAAPVNRPLSIARIIFIYTPSLTGLNAQGLSCLSPAIMRSNFPITYHQKPGLFNPLNLMDIRVADTYHIPVCTMHYVYYPLEHLSRALFTSSLPAIDSHMGFQPHSQFAPTRMDRLGLPSNFAPYTLELN